MTASVTSPATSTAPALSLRGNPSQRDIAAILIALALATGAPPARPAPTPADPDDPWGTPELALRRHLAAMSTLPHITADRPADPTPEGTPR